MSRGGILEPWRNVAENSEYAEKWKGTFSAKKSPFRPEKSTFQHRNLTFPPKRYLFSVNNFCYRKKKNWSRNSQRRRLRRKGTFLTEKPPFRPIAAIWGFLETCTLKWQLSHFFIEVHCTCSVFFRFYSTWAVVFTGGGIRYPFSHYSRTLEKSRLFGKVSFQPHFR